MRLLDDPALLNELRRLERRPGAGRDVIAHPPRGHDHLAAAAASSLVHARSRTARAIVRGAAAGRGLAVRHFRVAEDWRSRDDNLPTQPPRRDTPSDALEDARMLMASRDDADQRLAEDVAAHRRALCERNEIERWKPLVDAFGVDAVETVQSRVQPGFRVPDALRGGKE